MRWQKSKDPFDYSPLIASLKSAGMKFSAGISDETMDEAEYLFSIEFPESLRSFYSQALPVGPKYPKWNDLSKSNAAKIISMLEAPLEGIYFDVMNNGFWLDDWGPKPQVAHRVKDICLRKINEAPTLVPIFANRYMPVLDYVDDPPVISVHQADITYCGANLADYFMIENNLRSNSSLKHKKFPPIPFWLE